MPHIIVPISPRASHQFTPREIQAQRRKKAIEEEKERRLQNIPITPRAGHQREFDFPSPPDVVRGKPLLTTEQLAGGPGWLTGPPTGQPIGKLGKLERATAPIYAPGKMLLGGLHQSVMEPSEAAVTALGRRAPTDVLPEDFRYATLAGEPLGQTGMLFAGKEGLQKAWERFKTMRPAFTGGREGFSPFPFGPGLTQKQKEERPWQEELAGAALFAPAPILTVPKIPRAIGRGAQIAREAYLAKTMAPLPGRGSRIPPQLGKFTPSGPIIKPTDQPLPVRPSQQAEELYGRMEGRIAQPWRAEPPTAPARAAAQPSPEDFTDFEDYREAYDAWFLATQRPDVTPLRHIHARSPEWQTPEKSAVRNDVESKLTRTLAELPDEVRAFTLMDREISYKNLGRGLDFEIVTADELARMPATLQGEMNRAGMATIGLNKRLVIFPDKPITKRGLQHELTHVAYRQISDEAKDAALDEMAQDGNKVVRYLRGRDQANTIGRRSLNLVSRFLREARVEGVITPQRFKATSELALAVPEQSFADAAVALGIKRTDRQYLTAAVWLSEAERLGLKSTLQTRRISFGEYAEELVSYMAGADDEIAVGLFKSIEGVAAKIPTAPVRAAADVPTAPARGQLTDVGDIPSRIHFSDIPRQDFKPAGNFHRAGFTGIARKLEDFSGSGGHTSLFDESVVADVLDEIATNLNLNTVTFRMRDNAAKQVYNATQESLVERGLPETFNVFRVGKLPPTGAPTPVSLDKGILRAVHLTGKTQDAPILRMYEVSRKDVLADINAVSRNDFILEEELLVHAENLRFVADIDIAARAASEAPIGGIRPRAGGDIAIDAQGQTRQLESGVRGIAPEPVAPARVAPPDDVPPGRPPDEPPIGDGGDSDFGFGGVVNGDNPIDMRYIIPHLTGTQEVLNVLRKSPQILLDLAPVRFVAGKLSPKQEGELFTTIAQKPSPGFGVLDHPASQAAVTEYRRVGHAIQSMGNRVTFLADDIVKTFEPDEIDKFGRVVGIRGDDGVLVSLRGIDDTLTDGYFDAPGKKLVDPTLRDIAARLPLFEDYLRPATVVAIRRLGRLIDEYRSLLDTVGNEKILIDKKRDLQVKARITGRKPKPVEGAYEPVENPLRIGSREDVRKDGGVYFARGNAYDELADTSYLLPGEPYTRAILTNDSPSKLRGVGLQKVERRHATFRSESAGIEAGYEYTPLGVAVQNQILKYGNESLNTHMQNYYRSMADDTGQYLGRTPKMRMLDENPAIIKTMEALRNKVTSLKSSLGRLTQEERIAIDSFLYGEGGDINEFIIALGRIEITKGKRQGANIPMLQQLLKEAKEEADTFKPKYNAALLKAEHVPKKQAITGGETAQFKLEKLSFPEQIAQSTVKALQDIGPTGFWAQPHAAVKFYNGFFKATNATMDSSSIGIQGLISIYKELSDPKVWNQWVRGKPTPAIQAIFANFKSWFSPDVIRSFLATYDQRALENGVLDSVAWAKYGLQGPATEYTEALARPGLGTRVGRLPVIKQADRAFQAHGYTQRLGGVNTDLMNLLASKGWKPGQPIKQFVSDDNIKTIAKEWNRSTGQSHRRFLGPIGDSVQFAARFTSARLEFLGKGLMGSIPRVGPMPPLSLDQRLARNSFIRFYSSAITTTFAANYFRGYPTDVRPTIVDKNGKRHNNPNFMRIRNVFGSDISAFGPMNAMHNLFINAAIGSPAVFVNPGSGIMSLFEKIILQRDEFGREMPRPMDFPVGIGKEEFWDSGTARWVRSMIGEFIPWSMEEMGEILKPLADTDEGIPSRIGESLGRFTAEQLGIIKSRFTERDRRELEGVPFKPTGLPSGSGDRMRPSQNRSSGTTERMRPSQNRVGVR